MSDVAAERLPTVARGKRIRAFIRLFLGVVWDFWKEARLMRKFGGRVARERMSARHRRRAIQFRETAIKLGGVLIKLGQFFSARADVMPQEYIEELGKLQDEVPPVSFEEIKKVIEAEFKRPLKEIFKEFNPQATAAASLAQVHKAKLLSGENVAVKVQRPGIERLADIDLATFSYLMEGVHRFTRVGSQMDIPHLVEEFVRTLGDELDFYREGYNAERFKVNFAKNPLIYVPRIYWEYTTTRVLTLEEVGGIKISDYQALEEAGIDRHRVAQEVIESYLKQVLEDGFFHADPHPGNLFVVEGPLITFVDFGMVGEITAEMKEYFRGAIIGVARKDPDQMVQALEKLGFIRPGADVSSVKHAILWAFENYAGITTRDITFEKLEEIEEDIIRIVREQPLMIPAQFAFLGKAIGTLLGLATGLDPGFDFVEATKPYVKKITAFGAPAWQELVLSEAKALGKIFLDLPRQINETLDQAKKGNLRVKMDSPEFLHAIEDSSGSRFALAQAIIFLTLTFSALALLYLELIRGAYILAGLAIFFLLAFFRWYFLLGRRHRKPPQSL